jgi:DnaJ-domain-containing protein 1
MASILAAIAAWESEMKQNRFHGRMQGNGRLCDAPGCTEPGEFRAPGERAPGFDGPGNYRWFCLDHVRAFNQGYDFFRGMTREEIERAQSPLSGWAAETRAFRPTAGVDQAPRWADFTDPLDAISARARTRMDDMRKAQEAARRGIHPTDRRAYDVLGLGFDADRRALRARYSELVRRYHPDRNGGDRSHEARLGEVVEAYNHLRRLPAFA